MNADACCCVTSCKFE